MHIHVKKTKKKQQQKTWRKEGGDSECHLNGKSPSFNFYAGVSFLAKGGTFPRSLGIVLAPPPGRPATPHLLQARAAKAHIRPAPHLALKTPALSHYSLDVRSSDGPA